MWKVNVKALMACELHVAYQVELTVGHQTECVPTSTGSVQGLPYDDDDDDEILSDDLASDGDDEPT